ncbi:hypothetical protein ABW20_dc0100779 [Dactylellina cionopaga]|nr:hypothetical protein ABW20_dc0100779 [Dactylellina cionopaga]
MFNIPLAATLLPTLSIFLFLLSLVESYSITWFATYINDAGELAKEEYVDYIPPSPDDCWTVPSYKTVRGDKGIRWTPTGFSLKASLGANKFPNAQFDVTGYPPPAIALYDQLDCMSTWGKPIAVVRFWPETGTQGLEPFEDLDAVPGIIHVHGIYSIGARSFREIGEGMYMNTLWDQIVDGEGMGYGDVFEVSTIFGDQIIGEHHVGMIKAPVDSDMLEEIPEDKMARWPSELGGYLGSPSDSAGDYGGGDIGQKRMVEEFQSVQRAQY